MGCRDKDHEYGITQLKTRHLSHRIRKFAGMQVSRDKGYSRKLSEDCRRRERSRRHRSIIRESHSFSSIVMCPRYNKCVVSGCNIMHALALPEEVSADPAMEHLWCGRRRHHDVFCRAVWNSCLYVCTHSVYLRRTQCPIRTWSPTSLRVT